MSVNKSLASLLWITRVFVFKLFSRYTGEWNNGRINGRGKLFSFSPIFLLFLFNIGTIYLANGDRYTGEWKDARRHGNGVYIYSDGDRYEGEWRNDERVSYSMYDCCWFPKLTSLVSLSICLSCDHSTVVVL